MVFSATEARKQFFHILRLADKGEEIIIISKNTSKRFTIMVRPPGKRTSKN